MRGIIWFREDLRLQDNTALYYASRACVDGLIAVYFIDWQLWQKHNVAPCRMDFILRGLTSLQQALAELNIPLLVIELATSDIPEKLFILLNQIKATEVFFNHQYEINETRRDQQVIANLTQRGMHCHVYHDQCILAPGSVLTKEGKAFQVFTSYQKAWYKKLAEDKGIHLLSQPAPCKNKPLLAASIIPSLTSQYINPIDPTYWPASEQAANQRLMDFTKNNLSFYDKRRDFPAIAGTSQLSPYLAAGMISARTCFLMALQTDPEGEGAKVWLNELIWREFYKHLLVAVPRVSMNKPFQLATEKLSWKFDEQQWLAWKQGQTGFPLIDAAMRQLNKTGWMHNRLRMVVAMFLTKNLFFDWRLGEAYFMQNLIDGDLAANNGGWQWSASTGTDAAPYFRIFNPIRQSERFDPQGAFIRQYCPELNILDDYAIHDPYTRAPLLTKQLNYPEPIVNLEQTRLDAIAAFKKLR